MKINIKHGDELYQAAESLLTRVKQECEIWGEGYDHQLLIYIKNALIEYSEAVVSKDVENWNKLQKKLIRLENLVVSK